MDITRIASTELDRTAASQTRPAPAQDAEATPKTASAAAAPITADSATTAGGTAASSAQMAQTQANASAQADAAAVATATTTTTSEDDSAYQAILAKANSGQPLTSSELDVLRAKNPGLYAKAVQASSARQQLRTKMEENPAQAYSEARAASAAVSQAAASGDESLALVHRALQDEYQSFTRQYDHIELSGRLGQPPAEEA